MALDPKTLNRLFDKTVPVKLDPDTGRWYIQDGNPGFNSYANNRNGYGTEKAAKAAIRYYGGPRLPRDPWKR